MSKDKIKGLTIEIGGDTTELSKVLKKPNAEASELQSKLNAVNTALKLDPSNVDLLAQKERLLGQSIDAAKNKLELLKDAQEQFIKSGKNVDSAEYIELQKQIAITTKKLNKLTAEQKEMTSSLDKFSKKAEATSKKIGSLGDKVSGLSNGAMALGGAILAAAPATEELRSDLSFLEQNAKDADIAMETATDAFDTFNTVVNETDSSIEGVSNLLQAGFTESNLQKAVEGLTGAYIKFPDTMKIESLADSLQETLATNKATGQFAELLDRLGIGADNFSKDLAECSTEAQKQDLVLKTLADNGLNSSYDAWKNNNSELIASRQANQDLQESMAELGETVTPVVTKVTEVATKLLDKFNSLDPNIQKVILTVIAFVAVLSPVLNILSSITGGIGNISIAMTKISPILTSLSGTVNTVFSFISKAFTGLMSLIAAHPVIAIITAIIAVIVLLYNKCEWFRNGVNIILNNIKSFFKNGFDNVSKTLANAITTVKNTASKIASGLTKALDIASKLKTIGKNLVEGLWNGINNAKRWILNKISGFTNSILKGIKGFFGIHSPSKLMEKEIGKFLPAGIGVGIEKNSDLALNPLEKLQKKMTTVFDPSVTASVSRTLNTNNNIIIEVPIEAKLDGKPIYQNVVTRITRFQNSRLTYMGG